MMPLGRLYWPRRSARYATAIVHYTRPSLRQRLARTLARLPRGFLIAATLAAGGVALFARDGLRYLAGM